MLWKNEYNNLLLVTVTSKPKDISNYLGMPFLRIMEIIKKVILPVVLVGLLLLMFYPVCSADGTTDYFMLWILVGFPFRVRRMCPWLISKNYGLS